MTNEKLLEVIDRYGALLTDENLEDEHVLHVVEMLPQMRQMVVDARREKLMRWLGWVQAVLVLRGYFTLEEVKSHNMPDAE